MRLGQCLGQPVVALDQTAHQGRGFGQQGGFPQSLVGEARHGLDDTLEAGQWMG
jgi:hypothetical protein